MPFACTTENRTHLHHRNGLPFQLWICECFDLDSRSLSMGRFHRFSFKPGRLTRRALRVSRQHKHGR